MRYEQPAELANHLVFLSLIDANFTDEFGTTAQSAFADAWTSLEYFREHTPTEEGQELLEQCVRNLHAALACLERGDPVAGGNLVLEAEEIFKQARKFIALAEG